MYFLFLLNQLLAYAKNRSCLLGFPFNVGFSVDCLHIEDNTVLWCSCQTDPPLVYCRLFRVLTRMEDTFGWDSRTECPLILSREERETLEGVTSRCTVKTAEEEELAGALCCRVGLDRAELNFPGRNRAEDHFFLVLLVLLSERPVLLNTKDRRARKHSNLV